MIGKAFLCTTSTYAMNKIEKKELAEKLKAGILQVLEDFHPSLSKKLMKEAKEAGKDLSSKMMDIQKDLEKKARKALKKQKVKATPSAGAASVAKKKPGKSKEK
jgi:hypothetical protein